MDPRNTGIGCWVKVATDFDIQDLRKEAERNERRVQYLQEDMERTVQQCHHHEDHVRFQAEWGQEQLRLRALQAKRKRQQRLYRKRRIFGSKWNGYETDRHNQGY